MKTIFPPRPKSAIPPSELDRYDKTGKWLAQYKYNGQRNLIHISVDKKVTVWGRHGSAHLTYSLNSNIANEILSLPGLKNQEYWLDSELLTKTSATDTKGKIIIFDVLHAGSYLFLKSQTDRLKILDEICGFPRRLDSFRGMAYVISNNILMAPTFENDFVKRFEEKIQYDECEGLLLRKKNSTLDNFGQKEYEIGWMIRCRKSHKNYSF